MFSVQRSAGYVRISGASTAMAVVHRNDSRWRAREPGGRRSSRHRDRLVFARRTYDPDIYRFGAHGARRRGAIVSSFADFNASFSPDGSSHRLLFSLFWRDRERAVDIGVAAADGLAPQQLTRGMGELSGRHHAGLPRWPLRSRSVSRGVGRAAGISGRMED